MRFLYLLYAVWILAYGEVVDFRVDPPAGVSQATLDAAIDDVKTIYTDDDALGSDRTIDMGANTLTLSATSGLLAIDGGTKGGTIKLLGGTSYTSISSNDGGVSFVSGITGVSFLDYVATTNKTTISSDIEIKKKLFDKDDNAGMPGQILVNDTAGIMWQDRCEIIPYGDRLIAPTVNYNRGYLPLTMIRCGKIRRLIGLLKGGVTESKAFIQLDDVDKPAYRCMQSFLRSNTSRGRADVLADGRVVSKTTDTSWQNMSLFWTVP